MKHAIVVSLTVWALVVAATAAAPSAQGTAATAPAGGVTSAAEDDAARRTFETVCSACHETAIATTTLRTPQEWTEILELMSSYGASATDAQFVEIHRYLSRHHGRVNVNRATAAELQLVLDVSETVASALVDYRSTTRLTAADDLKNVPGFPIDRIEALTPHLQF